MIILLNFITRIFDLILSPFQKINPLYALLIIAVLTGLIMVTIFAKVSNQDKMERIKNLIKAHFLELRIYKNDIYETLSAQKKILRYNLSYIKQAFFPATIMFIPVLIILVQMNLRFGHRPLLPNEAVVVRTTLNNEDPMNVRLKLPAGVKLDTSALRIPDLGEVNWRIVPENMGEFDLEFISGGKKAVHRLIVSDRLSRIYPTMTAPNFEDVFLNPGHNNFLANESPFRTIKIDYPQRKLGLGLDMLPDWLVIFFATSICFGLILKKVFGIH